MGRQRLEEVIFRSMNDEVFLDRLLVAPEQVLRDFNLTDEEFKVVSTGDEILFNEMLGQRGSTTHLRPQPYNHSQHKGIAGQKPDLLPRVVSDFV